MSNYSGGPRANASSGTNGKDDKDVIYISEPEPEPELELSLLRTDAAGQATAPKPTSTRTGNSAPSGPNNGAGKQTNGSAIQANGAGKQAWGDGSLLRDPEGLRRQWESIQVGFVDNPRDAVAEAENLVSSTIGELVSVFRAQPRGWKPHGPRATMPRPMSYGWPFNGTEISSTVCFTCDFSLNVFLAEQGAGTKPAPCLFVRAARRS